MVLPDYRGGSIVNLMVSVAEAVGCNASPLYPPLRDIDTESWRSSRTLILLVVDGLGYEFLRKHDGALGRDVKGRLTSVFPSTTATAIPTFLTGRAPQQHGLTGWHMYLRELGGVIAVLPLTVRGSDAAVGKNIDVAEVFGAQPLAARLPVKSHVVSPRRIIHSEFNVSHTNGAHRHGYDSLAEMFYILTKLAGDAGAKRQFIYAYWPELDSLAHRYGLASPEVASAFDELDDMFARFTKSIADSDTTIVVTADHGIIDSDPGRLIELDSHPRLARMLLLPLCGERRVAYCYVEPEQGRAFEHYVRDVLGRYADCHASRSLIEQGYFGLGDPHPRLAERIGHYTLIMKDNYAIKDWLAGERRHAHVGMHGGLSETEMYVPLIVASA